MLITVNMRPDPPLFSLEFLGAGESKEEILHQYPSLEMEDIDACLVFASQLMDHRYMLKETA